MTVVLSVDFETRSVVDLRRTGVYPYAAHWSTDLWCMGYAFDTEDPQLWFPGQPLSERIVTHVTAGGELRAWNAQFERVMWNVVGVRKHGFPQTSIEQWVDTAAEAAAMALPRHLSQCAYVLGVQQQKDTIGHRLMLQMCRPRLWTDGRPVWWTVPEKLARLAAYCQQDVRTERDVAKILRRLGTREQVIYYLDQHINERGVQLDVPLATAAKALAESEIERQDALIAEATDGRVGAVTRIGKLKEWLAGRGVEVISLNKAALRDLLSDEQLPEDVQSALRARAEAAKSSVAKVNSMLDCVCQDGRMRGLLLYHGAATGRWAGRLVQPQNFPRPDMEDPEAHIEAVLRGEPRRLSVLSSILRSMLIARPGHELIAADFATIEARVLAWIAGQRDLIEAFRVGRPVYKEMAARIERVSVESVEKGTPLYQLGKATILGCGYGMGGKKFSSAAKDSYGAELSEERAKQIVAIYRSAYPRIPQYWRAIDLAAIRAVEQPGEVFEAGPVKYTRRGGYLWCMLPSGRPLAYAAPRVVERETPWGEMRFAVEVSGTNSVTHQWERFALYGGLLTENVVQAISRDLMAEAMLRVEAGGYPIVLSVHDEIVAEVPEGFGSVQELEELMSESPKWAIDCPIAAEGWRGLRYRK